MYCRTGVLLLQTQGLLKSVEIFRIKDGRQSGTVDCALGSHRVLAHIAGVGYLLGKHNNFQTHIFLFLYVVKIVITQLFVPCT